VTAKSAVYCAKCDAVLDESPGLGEHERSPCPICGSRDRHVDAAVADEIQVTDSIGELRKASTRFVHNPWLVAVALALTLAGSAVGYVVGNWWIALLAGLALAVASFVVGAFALTRERETEIRRPL
jgi:hypothetical protein